MADWTEPEFLTLLNPALSDAEVADVLQFHEIGGVQTVREAVHTWHQPGLKVWGLSRRELRVLDERRARAVCPECRQPLVLV